MNTIELWEQEIAEKAEKDKILKEEAIYNFYDDIEGVKEGFIKDTVNKIKNKISGKKKDNKKSTPKSEMTPEVLDNLDMLNTKVDDIKKVIEDEYNKNTTKWDKMVEAAVQKARKKLDISDEDVEFNIEIEDTFDYWKGMYHLFVYFLDADQVIGLEIENEIFKAFTSAISSGVKKALDGAFVKFEPNQSDSPGYFYIIADPKKLVKESEK